MRRLFTPSVLLSSLSSKLLLDSPDSARSNSFHPLEATALSGRVTVSVET